MDKRIIMALALMAATAVKAQDINYYTPGENEGIAYFLPKTAIEVNVIATKVKYTPGDFCQYANRYLRISNVSSEPQTYWKIKQIDVRSAGVPDSTKAYIVKLSANNRYYYVNGSLQKEVYFFDLIAWGYTAEKVAVNLLKGRHILVNGELRQNSYIAKDGSRKNSIYILALEVKSLDKKTIEKNNYYNSANNQIVSDVIEESLEQAF